MDEQPLTPDPVDDESDIDSCEIEVEPEDTTADEDLPACEGGVA